MRCGTNLMDQLLSTFTGVKEYSRVLDTAESELDSHLRF